MRIVWSEVMIHQTVVALEGDAVIVPMHRHREGVRHEGAFKRMESI
jgi:hypothetical protein